MGERFVLSPEQVPGIPKCGVMEPDFMRWCICVMDPQDKSIRFIAEYLSILLSGASLTEEQVFLYGFIVRDVTDAYYDGKLHCQQPIHSRAKNEREA